jgi:drug/metabolite transporter (DMT)-like permease
MLAEVVFFLLIMIAGTAGELCMARAMRTVGEVTDFRPRALLGVASRALTVGWTWIGVGLMALAFFALLAVLAVENVSFVVPVTALSYAVGALGARAFLHERVTRTRWAGVLLVCIGVTMVLLGKRWS